MDIPCTLDGRVAVVTGASSGIGAQLSRQLAAAGARVAMLARRADRLRDVVAQIEADGGTAGAYPVDVTDPAAVAETAKRVRADFGATGVLVNNAGLMLPTPVARLGDADTTRQVDLNVSAVNTVVGAFLEDLLAAADQQGCADLVTTASVAAHDVFPGFPVYAATKAYVAHLAANLRQELAPLGVRVTTVEPGIVDTELQNQIADENVRHRLADTRHRIDWLTPADVAEVILFAVSRPARVSLPSVPILPAAQTQH